MRQIARWFAHDTCSALRAKSFDAKRVDAPVGATQRNLRAQISWVYRAVMQTSEKVTEAIVKLVPGGTQALSHLSDAEVLANTRRLVAASNKLFAALLLHLGEVEARGIHRTRACASLYTY